MKFYSASLQSQIRYVEVGRSNYLVLRGHDIVGYSENNEFLSHANLHSGSFHFVPGTLVKIPLSVLDRIDRNAAAMRMFQEFFSNVKLCIQANNVVTTVSSTAFA